MIDVLNSVMIKHDTNFKSLTKIALSQVILKIIYENHGRGIMIKAIKAKIIEYADTKFTISELEDSIQQLRNQNKVHFKDSRHFLKEDFKASLDLVVKRSEELHRKTINKWFGKSETAQLENGDEILTNWFNRLLIEFFKEYRYDWINDLKQRGINGKKHKYNIDISYIATFKKCKILEADFEWLRERFMGFLESSDSEDNEVLWGYGSSMFSATLITAKNYADDFSIDMFKDSYFVLDTNILMTLGLEGHELHYAFLPIEKIFIELKIDPVYYYISKDEYRRAITRKRDATFAVLEKFGYKVIKESDCGIIQTAIGRLCKTKEDFSQFFKEIEEIPKFFCDKLKLIQLDYLDLHDSIEVGQKDEKTHELLNDICYSRSKHYKSKNVLEHDSGLLQGTIFLNKTRKSWILTKDGALREFANKTKIREDNPIAIGLDSFIQMMAINHGGIEENSSNFAPLFAKIVQFSLLLEKDIFKVEDLYFILDTQIDIQDLKQPEILSIAKKVNHLRIENKPDDEIALEIRRFFQKAKVDYEAYDEMVKTEMFNLGEENRRVIQKASKLEQDLFFEKYSKARDKIRKSIFWNWVKLISIPLAIAVLSYFILKISTSLNTFLTFISSVGVELIGTLISIFNFRPKLRFNTSDKENLEKRILEEIENIKFPDNK
jgi:hypothetical protein